jgi:hypothetical protein
MDRRLYMVLPICSFSSLHGCYRWYLSNEGAENALLAKLIFFMRRRCRRCTPSQSTFIFNLCRRVAGRKRVHTFSMNQTLFVKSVDHLPPHLRLRRVLDAKHHIGVVRRLLHAARRRHCQPSADMTFRGCHPQCGS